MTLAAAAQELRITLRNGEQVLLALIIPLAALIGMSLIEIGGIDDPRVDTVTPGILALAILSSAFTSQAITTGFDRRYGVLKRLAATGFPRWLLLALLGVAAFVGLALLLGGTLRAEAVLAVANLVWLVLLGIGGVLIPLSNAPEWLRVVGELTPAGALSTGLRDVLTAGEAPGAASIVVLVVWVLLGWLGTVRWFRWQ